MSSDFLFTREDYEALCRKIEEIEQKVKEYTANVGHAVDSAGDQWHDANLYYVQRMSESWSENLRDLLRIKMRSRVVTGPPPRDGKVWLGKIVKIRDLESGEILFCEISSYMVFELEREKEKKPKRISYMSPLGKLLIGAKVGEIREGIIGDKKKSFQIIEIIES